MNIRLFTLSLLVTSLPFFTHAGAISGGGGKGIVCRDSAGNITSAETLDLYEGRALYGLQIQKSSAPMDVQIQNALNVIPGSARGLVETYVKSVKQAMKLSIPGTELTPINDSFETSVPRNCKAEQLANYFNDKLVLINSDIWSHMGETDRAALIMHEAFYATERLAGATDSQRSRHVVASLFDSKTNWIEPLKGVPARTTLICTSHAAPGTKGGGYWFYAFKNADSGWTLQFTSLGGMRVMSKKTVELYGSDFDFLEAKTVPVILGDDKVGESTSSYTALSSDFESDDIIGIVKRWEAVKFTGPQPPRPFQTPRYYISWKSSTYPNTAQPELLLNCGIESDSLRAYIDQFSQ